MGGAYTLTGITSITHGMQSILGYEGRVEGSFILIGKSVINGARDYDQQSLPYKPGTVAARRAEGLSIAHSLNQTARLLNEVKDVEQVGKHILPKRQLEQLLKEETESSLILPHINTYLSRQGTDYRTSLATLGEELEQTLSLEPTTPAPLDVDLTQLDARRIDLQVKHIFRQYKRLLDKAETLATERVR